MQHPIIYHSYPHKNPSFCKLRHIRFTHNLKSTPRYLKHFSSLKKVHTANIFFNSPTIHQPTLTNSHSRTFSLFLKHTLTNKHIQNIHLHGNIIHSYSLLKFFIMKATRLQGLSISLKDHEKKIIPYLKQIHQLTLTFVSKMESFIPLHVHPDALKLLHLTRLTNLELVVPNEDVVPGLRLELRDLGHFMAVFSCPEFKASVKIRAPELVSHDKTITVVPARKGSAHIISLRFGCVDEESFAFIVREADAFPNIKDLAFKLKINKNSMNEYLLLLPLLGRLNKLQSLTASFMLPFFHFDAQEIFKSLQLPKGIQELGLSFHPIAFCAQDELLQSDFLYFNKELEQLGSLKSLALHFVVSNHMDTCYYWIGRLTPNLKSLENLQIQLDYHVEPTHTEENYVQDIIRWPCQIDNLKNLGLYLDFPNFLGLDKLIFEHRVTFKNLRRFVFRTPKEKTFKDDNFSEESLGILLKLLEPSYGTLEQLMVNVSSVNFRDECFGILLHAVSEMKRLREFNCDIHEGDVSKKVFHAFEDSLGSLDSIDEMHVSTDVPLKGQTQANEGGLVPGRKKSIGEGVLDAVSSLLKWRN